MSSHIPDLLVVKSYTNSAFVKDATHGTTAVVQMAVLTATIMAPRIRGAQDPGLVQIFKE